MSQNIQQRLTEIDRGLSARCNELEQQIESLENSFDYLTNRVEQLAQRISDIDRTLDRKCNDLENEIYYTKSDLQSEIRNIESQVSRGY